MAYNDAVNNILTADNFYGNNPYSQFSGQPLPWPSSYAGTPTDAQGRPIQAQPGTTLNTPSPAAAAPPPAAGSGQQWGAMYPGGPVVSQTPSAMSGYRLMQTSPGGQVTGGQAGGENAGMGGATGGTNIPAQYQFMPNQQPAPAAPTSTQAPGTQSLQTALSALAHPGPVTTPGAQPMAPQGPSVLQSFLANNQGGRGAGNYSNQGFFNTLNALKGGAGATP
jgi:hypothetical protein